MITLYFEDIKITNYIDTQKKSDPAFLVDILQQIKIRSLTTNISLYWHTEAHLWHALQEHTQLVEAAGGIVYNDKKEILLIHRNKHWDLPKGKREGNEDGVKNAKREIEEETHVGQLTYHKDLDITYHLYWIDNICVFKKTYWYIFHSSHQGMLQPQKEEGIDEVKWICTEHISQYNHKMFLLIRELVYKYLQLAIQ